MTRRAFSSWFDRAAPAAEFAWPTDVWVRASETLGIRWPYMEGPGLGLERPSVFERSDLVVRRSRL